MNTLLFVYGAFVAFSKLQSLNVTVDSAAWNSFKLEHAKVYANQLEENVRSAIFTWNKHKIDQFNELESSKFGYSLAVNKWSDLSDEEFSSSVAPLFKDLSNEPDFDAVSLLLQLPNEDLEDVPKEIDWRKSGRVTDVKDQGACRAGWAFAAVGALEGQELKRNFSLKSTIELSVQNIVDCGLKSGCENNLPDTGYTIVATEGGINDAASYPYQAKKMQCRFDKTKTITGADGFMHVKPGSEVLVKKIVAKYGPVSAMIDIAGDIRHYSSGVYVDDKYCKFYQLKHGVLIVGYGHDSKGGDYWIVVSCLIQCRH